MQFQDTAKAVGGMSPVGTLEASSPAQAIPPAGESALAAVTLRSEHLALSETEAGPSSRWTSRRVRKTDLLMVTSQLSIMCQADIDLAEALRSVARECRHPVFQATLNEIYEDVSHGLSASVAIQKHRHIFGEAYVASIAAAEASGSVTQVLPRLAEMLRNEIRMQSGLAAVAAYPIVLCGVAGIVMTVLVFFVLPQFSQVFESLGRPAPPMTALLLDTAQLLRANVLWIIGGLVMAGVALSQVVRSDVAGRYLDRVLLNGPLVRNATRALLTGRTFRMMGTMLQSGVPLLETVRLCRTSVRNQLFRELFHDLESDVVNGNGIGMVMRQAEFIPPGAAQMIATAEMTGKLGDVMELIGEFYEEEGERLVRGAVKLLEPAIIVLMGVVVAGVVLSVILPLLDVSTISR